MKIVNETVYSTDDLRGLFISVEHLCVKAHKEHMERLKQNALAAGRKWKIADWQNQRPLPETLRIGYYNAKPTPLDDEQPAKRSPPAFSSIRSAYSESPRIGIIRPDQLPLNPLVVLANCADGANRALPPEVVAQIAQKYSQCRSGSPGHEVLTTLSEMLQVRFSLRVKRGAKKAAKSASRQARIARLEQRIGSLTNQVASHDEKMRKAEAKRDALQIKLAKLTDQERMSLCV